MTDEDEERKRRNAREVSMVDDLQAWLAEREPSEHGLFSVTGINGAYYTMNEKTTDLADAVALFNAATEEDFDRVILGQSPHLLASKTWRDGVERVEWEQPVTRQLDLVEGEDEKKKRQAGQVGSDIYDEVAAARELKRERLASEIAGHQHAAAVLIGVNDDQSFLQFVHAEAKAIKLTELGGGVAPHLPQPDDEDEKKKRQAGQAVDMGNAAHAQLGANIRPDIGSSPAGLETYTTQKSATYQAFPAERQVEQPPLTLEAMERDPLSAIYAPLPNRPSYELLSTALGVATEHWGRDDQLGKDASLRVDELFAADAKALRETGEVRAPLGVSPELWGQAQQEVRDVAQSQETGGSDRVAAFLQAERDARNAGQSDEELPQPQQQQADDQTQTGDRVAAFLHAENAAREERREAVKELGGEEGEEATQEQGEDIAPVLGGGFSIS